MSNGVLREANILSNRITDGAKDLFSERARWVQTWITARALPFIALLTLAFNYYRIGSGEVVIPRSWTFAVAWTLLFIVVIRAIPHMSQRQWQKIFGNYQISFGFLGLLLLLGDSYGEHSLLYWGVLLAGFLGIGLIYPKKWSMPGEFGAVSLMLSGIVIGSKTPCPGWLFILVMVAPVMVYLQWKHQLLKPVLFLAALMVGVLLISEIRDRQVILAVFTALVLLWVAIYSIGKLNQKDASSFIQNVGIGVISGILFAIFVKLIGFPSDSALTWWAMFVFFVGISALLYKRNGSKLCPVLILWNTHWMLVSLTMSWEEWLKPVLSGEFYSFQVAAIMGSLLLQYFAFKLNNNRMLVWARIYLILVALSIGGIGRIFLKDDGTTIFRLIFALAVFAFAIWAARATNLAKGPPWWKGAVNPRHVVAIRQIMRKGGNFIGSIPFIGATASAIIKTVRVFMKLKRDGSSMHSGDVLLIIWVIILSLFLSLYIDKFLLSGDIAQTIALVGGNTTGAIKEVNQDVINKAKDMVVAQSSYLIAGLLFGIVALKERQPLYPLMAMVSFLLAPATIIGGDYFVTTSFWLISMIAAIGILSVREFSRQTWG